MRAQAIKEFKYECTAFLSTLGIVKLRPYARYIGVDSPTKEKKKEVLIEEILLVLTGEVEPTWSNRGAPVKNNYVDPEIIETVEKLRSQYLNGSKDVYDFTKQYKEIKENPFVLRVEDPDMQKEDGHTREIYRGQLTSINNVPFLLPLDCKDPPTQLVISVEQIHLNDLRDGDVITCYAKKNKGILVASDILTINGLVNDRSKRAHFDACDACFPTERIRLSDGQPTSITAKYLQWLLPFGKGQRGCIISSPKNGKTTLLAEIAAATSSAQQDLTVLAVLIDQPPEIVGQFRKILKKDNFISTSYEDSPERKVFVAEFLLNRAKRFVERGLDVVLFIDSLTALAHAYNETKDSVGGKMLSCGLESKTLQFIKRYFGSARCLEKGGSLTILSTLSTATGDPVDDVLFAELSPLANFEIRLSDRLAIKRIFPAIELQDATVKQSRLLFTPQEESFDVWLRGEYLPLHGEEGLRSAMMQSKTYEEFADKLKKDF